MSDHASFLVSSDLRGGWVMFGLKCHFFQVSASFLVSSDLRVGVCWDVVGGFVDLVGDVGSRLVPRLIRPTGWCVLGCGWWFRGLGWGCRITPRSSSHPTYGVWCCFGLKCHFFQVSASCLVSSDLRGVVLFWFEMSLFSGKRLVPRLIRPTGCGVVMFGLECHFFR